MPIKAIKITSHAKQRLTERVKSFGQYQSWENLVKNARYNGKTIYDMSDEDYDWCITHLRGFSNSHKIRVMDGFVYIFAGNNHHARTLITVIPIGETNTSMDICGKDIYNDS